MTAISRLPSRETFLSPSLTLGRLPHSCRLISITTFSFRLMRPGPKSIPKILSPWIQRVRGNSLNNPTKPYHAAVPIPEEGFILVSPDDMTIDEAYKFVNMCILGSAPVNYILTKTNRKMPICSVWALSDNHAKNLCKKLVEQGTSLLAYGKSAGPNRCSEFHDARLYGL